MYTEKKQTMILILDEAQYLNTGILNDLKMLMNFNYDTQNYFTLILFGEPLLKITLGKPVHMSLRQLVTGHYECKGLQYSEVKDYILFKLKQAGGTESMIDQDTLNAETGFWQGTRRLIDNLMTDAPDNRCPAGTEVDHSRRHHWTSEQNQIILRKKIICTE